MPSEYTRSTCSLNQWVRKSCGLNHECGKLEKIFFHFSSTPNCGGGDRDGGTIYCPFKNFIELNRTVTCMMLKAKANDRRTSSPLPR
ncbi:hypothetical protein TNCV_4578091 [Trichonephila clavipes]|nr:hypothetical protein TNCV_4578091 [Trichonephila clavipes]